MHRILIDLPALGLRVHSFGVLLMLACLGAYQLAAWRARREGIDSRVIPDLALWLFLGGFVGARLQFFIQNPGIYRRPADLLMFWQGGIVFYGCILGGLAGSVLFWTRRRFPFLATADAVAPGLALGIALGRVGCFLNGCCFGDRCHAPWAVRFPAGSLPWMRHVEAGWISATSAASLPIHPKQLYLAAGGFVLLGLLLAFYPRRRRDGEVMALLMVGYPITRFLTEFFRGDAGGYFGGLTISQYISIGLTTVGLAFWFALSRRPAGRLADAARPASTIGRPHVTPARQPARRS